MPLLLPFGLMKPPAAAGGTLLLDTLTGTTVRGTYALRKLRAAHAGAAIRVRRSSDDDEQDVGFAGGLLDTTALTGFVGASQGFITTWYDQSGLGQDLVQATAAAQPEITNASGVVHTLPGATGSRPAVKLVPGNVTRMACASFSFGGAANTLGFALVLSPSAMGYAEVLQYTLDLNTIWWQVNAGAWNFTTSGNLGTSFAKKQSGGALEAQYNWFLSAGGAYAVQGIANGTDLRTWGNGTEGGVNVAASEDFLASGALCLGGRTDGSIDGYVGEVIVAAVMSTADRATIETDQRSYFGF